MIDKAGKRDIDKYKSQKSSPTEEFYTMFVRVVSILAFCVLFYFIILDVNNIWKRSESELNINVAKMEMKFKSECDDHFDFLVPEQQKICDGLKDDIKMLKRNQKWKISILVRLIGDSISAFASNVSFMVLVRIVVVILAFRYVMRFLHNFHII